MKNLSTHIATVLPLCLLLCLLLCPRAASAAEGDSQLDQELDLQLDQELEALLAGQEEFVYKFPVIAPQYSAVLGYRMVDISGPASVLRFGHPDDSVVFSGQYRAFWFPHRFMFVYDREGENGYFGEVRYSYGDKVFLRYIGNEVYRNPETVTPVDLDTATLLPGVSVNDADTVYGIRKNSEDIFLRLKHPGHAAHMYVRAWMVHEAGSMQQRALLGSGWFNEIVRDTSLREYDWETHDYTFGINGHLGPLEVEASHLDGVFRMNSDSSTTSYYEANAYRDAGFYPHHLYSDLSRSGNTLMVHTSYTGKLVASATLSGWRNSNDTSSVEAKYLSGSTGITWMPMTTLTLFLRCRHTDMDLSGQDSATMGTNVYAVKPGISSVRDSVSLRGRFRPIPDLVIRGRYKVEKISRDNALSWGLSSAETTKRTYAMSAKSRQIKDLGLKAEYEYTETDDPAYNTESDIAHRVKASADWRTTRKLTTFVSISTTASKRHSLEYPGTLGADNRLAFRDAALLSMTYIASERLSISGSYNYYLSSVKQDLIYDLSGTPTVSPDVVYEDKIHGVSLDISYLSSEKLTLAAGASYTRSEGSFETHNIDLLDPIPVSELVNTEVSIGELRAQGQYDFSRGLWAELDYYYKQLSEDYINPYDALSDSDVQVVMLKAGKKW